MKIHKNEKVFAAFQFAYAFVLVAGWFRLFWIGVTNISGPTSKETAVGVGVFILLFVYNDIVAKAAIQGCAAFQFLRGRSKVLT